MQSPTEPMLGSEYNWLITFTRLANGMPKISLARTGLFTLAVAVFCLFCIALQAEPLHRELLREASVAAKANDTAQFIAKLEAARALRPDYPRILIALARAYTANGRADEAIAQLRRFHSLPADDRAHVLGDFVLAADGTIYVSDSTSPVIWRLLPGGTQLEKWLEHPDFVSLQGLAFTADGKSLHVADYANGIWRIELPTQAVTRLKPPVHRTLFGIDGIYAVAGGLIAIQNGMNPQRIVRITLGTDGQPVAADALLWGRPAMNDLALGQVTGGRFEFIGNSGWSLYEKPDSTPPARTLSVFSLPL